MGSLLVERPATGRLPSVPSRTPVDSSLSASNHYESHSANVPQVPQVLPWGEAPAPGEPSTHFVVEQPYVDPRWSLPDSTAWERAAEPSPPSSGEHSERSHPNRRAERPGERLSVWSITLSLASSLSAPPPPVNWDTDSSSYPTTSGSSAPSTSSGTIPSHSSSPHDTTVSDSSSYPTSSSTSSARRSSSSLSSASSQQRQGRAATSSSGGLGDVSESSEPPLDRSAEDGDLFHRPTQPPRLPDVTQVDIRMLAPRSTRKKISDESTTSSSSCGPPQQVGAVMALRGPPRHPEGRGREESRGAQAEGSDAKKGEMQLEAQEDSLTSYKVTQWTVALCCMCSSACFSCSCQGGFSSRLLLRRRHLMVRWESVVTKATESGPPLRTSCLVSFHQQS